MPLYSRPSFHTRLFPKLSVVVWVLIALMNVWAVTAHAQGRPAAQYLPDGLTFDTNIPTPEQYLGANVGEWHVRHDQLVGYMHVLAQTSSRVSIIETGRTHENRPLLLLAFTQPNQQEQLEQLKLAHYERVTSGKKADNNDPLVFYMGYSIHGNEPSGANAALVVAYYLAAAQGPQVDALLQNIILLDPSLNPDGLARFAQWANMHRGHKLTSDPEHREHREGWPSARTNHFWFDLNRDWLLLTHPESRARIAQFQAWRPHILTDFHEMGTNSTYFFQPGVRSRKNPLTPDANVTLTEALARYHAAALDSAGQLYYSEEDFDDFYVGKGSTYPDIHGSIGILFEQASSRGHVQDSINGPLSFADTIQNQVTTSLSTFAGALANKAALHDYQASFYTDTEKLINADDDGAYLVAMPQDHARFQRFLSILEQHKISYQWVMEDTSHEGLSVKAKQAVVIALNQPQYRLLKSIFTTRQSFNDNTFYDVSNWNIGMAFNLDYRALSKRELRRLEVSSENLLVTNNSVSELPSDAYAYAFEWHHYYAPALLNALLNEGIQVRSAGGDFQAQLSDGNSHNFAAGTVVIPSGLAQPENLVDILNHLSSSHSVPLFSLKTGHTAQGIDIGSRDMLPLRAPKVLLVGGRGSSQYEVGEIWHYLDTRVEMPVTIVEQWRLASTDLSAYTHIIFASGRYQDGAESAADKLGKWVEQGGVLIGQRTALRWFAKQGWLPIDVVSQNEIDALFSKEDKVFADRSKVEAKKIIAGSVYRADIDRTHPLFFGYNQDSLHFFKSSNMLLNSDANVYKVPARYTQAPLVAGYSDSRLVTEIAESPAVITESLGRGKVVGFTDNIHFRGYWYGTDKLLSNAIFQAPHF